MILREKNKRDKTLRWLFIALLIFYDFLIIARVVTSQSHYYTFIVSKAWMILQAQDENINETDSSEDFDDSFLICSGYGNKPEYTEHEMNSLVYSDGSETSEEDEKDSSRLEIIHKICYRQDMFTDKYIYILQLINYLYLHCIVLKLYSNSIIFKYNKGRKN